MDDLAPAAWIPPRLLGWGHGSGTRVGAVVPTGFEAYARLPHPVQTGPGSWTTWAQVARQTGRTAHARMQWETITHQRDGELLDFGAVPDEALPRHLAQRLVSLVGRGSCPCQPRPLDAVGLGLTYDEARELRDSLHALLDDPVGRHEHVSSADYRAEVTVFVVGDDGRPLGQRETYRCPVCGYAGFEIPPWDHGASGSLEICPSCGLQFGYTDAAGGDPRQRAELHRRWREAWIAEGMPWRGAGDPPEGWDPAAQLEAATTDDGTTGP